MRSSALTVWLILMLVGAAGAWSADSGAPEAIRVSLEVERVLLDEDLARQAEATRRRAEADGRLSEVRLQLEAALRPREMAGAAERLDPIRAELDRAEADRATALASERAILDRLRDHLRRIALYEQKLAEVEGRQDSHQAGTLDGTWDLVLMPTEQRGSCTLRQEGTLVTGTYRLEGGFSGSLQGTLVNHKLLLHRIDSKLGKSMELEGYLSADGKVIRGTWLNYELAGREGSTGQWLGERRPPRAEPPPADR